MAIPENDGLSRRGFARVAGATLATVLAATSTEAAGPKEQKVVKPDKDHPLEIVCSRFGFRRARVRQKDGKRKEVWMAATENDYREAEARRTGKKPAEIVVDQPRESDGALDVDSCAMGQTMCIGFCTDGTCVEAYDEVLQMWYCYCQKA